MVGIDSASGYHWSRRAHAEPTVVKRFLPATVARPGDRVALSLFDMAALPGASRQHRGATALAVRQAPVRHVSTTSCHS